MRAAGGRGRTECADVERELSQITRREAQSRSSPESAGRPFAHPRDWAGFILMGDPDWPEQGPPLGPAPLATRRHSLPLSARPLED
jgi:hypothetical protein